MNVNKPKIFVFTTTYHPFIGGAEIAVAEVAKRLGNKFDFFIFTSRMRADLSKREVRDEGLVIRIGFGNRLDKFWLLAFGWVAALREILKQRQKIIFWVMDFSFGAAAAGFLKIFYPTIPLVFTIQYGYGDERVARGRFGFMNVAFRLILAQADHVTAISAYLLNLCRQYGYVGPEAVIHNGVDLEQFKRAAKPAQQLIGSQNGSTIVTVSRLVPKNGVDILIKAFAETKKEIPDIKLHIIGDGAERKNLENLAYGLRLKADITFFGDVSHDEIPEYLANADIFVRPSRSEGMGNAFVEALAAGLPIIGTPVGGILDIIKEPSVVSEQATGLFTKVDDPEDLAEKIKILLSDGKLRERIVENGRKMVKERFLWDTISHSYEQVFSEKLAIKKRILIATGIFPPDVGGPATYSKILLDELPKHNFGVRILSFGSVRHLPTGIRHIIYFLRILWLGCKADIIFAQDLVSVGFPTMLAAEILQKRFILKIVGDYAWEQYQQKSEIRNSKSEMLSPEEFQKGKYDFFTEARRFVERLVAKRAEIIIVPSEYLKGIVVRWGVPANKIHIIYNAFEPSRNNEPFRFPRLPRSRGVAQGGVLAKPAQRLIVSAGRLVPWKGFGALIEIMPELSKKFPDLKLIIIGDGPDRSRLEKLTWPRAQILQDLAQPREGGDLPAGRQGRAIPQQRDMRVLAKFSAEDKIVFTGNLPREKVLDYLIAADVFVLNTAYEGFSHQILEAMSLGVPVVTTDAGGNPELIEDGKEGFLVKFNDKKALVDKISTLLLDKHLAYFLAEKAQKKAQEFSLERMVNDTISLLG